MRDPAKLAARAYVWSQAYSVDQVKKVSDIGCLRQRFLSTEMATLTQFSRCQLCGPNGWHNHISPFDGIWDGEVVRFDPVFRHLGMEYTAQLYQLAAHDMAERFPRFAEHVIEDGPDIGERRLYFTTGQHDLAANYLRNKIWSLHDQKVVAVHENIRVEANPKGDARRGQKHLKVFVDLDCPVTDPTTWNHIRDQLSRGHLPTTDPTPHQCDISQVSSMITSLSVPELVLLNWKQIRNPLSPAETAMFKAAAMADPEGIALCLANGANPNAINDSDLSAITTVVQYDLSGGRSSAEADGEEDPAVLLEKQKTCIRYLLDAGAHIDAMGAEGMSPVTAAALQKCHQLLDWILKLGANDTVDGVPENCCDLPPAWDYAITDEFLDAHEDWAENSALTLKALEQNRQAPDGSWGGKSNRSV